MSLAAQDPRNPENAPPVFDTTFRTQLETLIAWRRDVRRFRTDPVAPELIERLVRLANLAPSVGNSQPWRWVSVESEGARSAIRANFAAANASALAAQDGERAALYARLKLAGLDRAPVQLAAFCDEGTEQGHGLGRLTMPETLAYSVVCAIATFWLAARAEGLGVGWVSILDPQAVKTSLDVDERFRLVAYLCVGYPEEDHLDPELQRAGWQARDDLYGLLDRR